MAKFFIPALTLALVGAINATGYSNGNGDLPDSVESPIFSSHNVNVHKVAGSIERHNIPEIVISSGPVAIKMTFESQSTELEASQKHENADGKSDSSDSQDGEIVMKHHVTKPIVQYVDEEIIPSRFLSQKIFPVKEHVKTIVTKQSEKGEDAEPEPAY